MKRFIYIVIPLVLLYYLFRLTLYLFPVHREDIRTTRFHSVKFYDRHGNLLQEVLSESSNRAVFVPLEEVSPYFIQAIIATEDRNFYRHHGVDYPAVLRALWQNVKSGRIVSGASTITLQLARLLHPKKRTLFNKIREAYFAFRLEAGLDKRTILEEYLNRLPMGGNLYGVESAARAYFGIPASELTLAQATYLAAIPNSPNRYNPYHNPAGIKQRQKIVLQRMARAGFIPPERIPKVFKENIILQPVSSSFLSPHFVFYLLRKLPDDASIVRTTLDARWQRLLTEQIHRALYQLKNYHVTNAAALLVDNRTGEVLAYVGSANFFNETIQGQVDGVQALRQPGSALKPFLYQLAMEKGFNPATLISDISTHYRMPEGVYSPRNYSEDFHGPVRLREALANSLNIPAVRTLAKIGVADFLERLREYGFTDLRNTPEHYGVGLALGDGEVSLYQLTRAYSCLARYGKFRPLREILEINNQPVPDTAQVRTISQPVFHFLISDILSDPFARTTEFGAHSVLNLPFLCAAKTGTSFRFCDNWTVGYTPDYTLGVWVGNFDHTPMMRVSGVTGAGPIFASTMLLLYHDQEPPVDFPVPEGVVKLSICPLSGKRPTAACPTRSEEWFPARDTIAYWQDSCRMHIQEKGKVKVVLPERFRQWAQQMGWEVKETIQNEKAQLFRIVNPVDGSVYHRLPNLAASYQSVRFQLQCSHPGRMINWYLNDQLVGTTQNEHILLWQASPGEYHLRAEDAENPQVQDEVSFRVK